MNKKYKSILAIALSAMMLLSACAEKDNKKDKSDKKDTDSKASSLVNIDTNFNFKGFDNVVAYSENAVTQIEDALNGNVDTGVTTELSLLLGNSLKEDIGVDVKEFKLSNSASVKGGLVGNNTVLYYDGKSLISLNSVIDDQTAYFLIPEVSDSYLKGDLNSLESMISGGNSVIENDVVSNPIAMIANPNPDTIISGSADMAGQLKDAISKFDEGKISTIFNDLLKIVEDNLPIGRDGENASGDINGIKFEYSTKDYVINGTQAYNATIEILTYLKNNKDIAEEYNSILSEKKQELLDSGYYTQEELDYPSFEQLIDELINSMSNNKEDYTESDDKLELTFYYDGDETTGIKFDVDGTVFEMAVVDREDEFGIKIEFVETESNENMTMAMSVAGSDGKFDAKIVYDFNTSEDEYDAKFETGFNTDVTVIDEESGAFTGEIEIYVDFNEESYSLALTSNSTKDNTDFSIDVIANNEVLVTIGLTSVVTNASDITVPSSDVYDLNDQSQVETYYNSCDLTGLESHFKSVLGDELFELIFESDDYNDDEYDWDYDEEDWY